MTDTMIRPTDHEAMRHAMVVSQLRPSGVDDARVVAAMATVPREAFVPAEVRDFAYRDRSLPLTGDRRLSPPLATGLMLVEARLRPTDRVLLIGAACGYAAAVLAGLVASVVAVEEDATLAAFARTALSRFDRVTLIEAPLSEGAPEHAPYDVILVDGAVEALPAALGAQLVPGGRIISGLVERAVTRLARGTATPRGIGLAAFIDTDVARLPGFAAPTGFSF